ncbi:hypothetical protein CXIVA_08670 [Clostridium sp. SY8519]|nr:hypothetical protein CXIVA_08670 [Clostridium sp. SY8519]
MADLWYYNNVHRLEYVREARGSGLPGQPKNMRNKTSGAAGKYSTGLWETQSIWATALRQREQRKRRTV